MRKRSEKEIAEESARLEHALSLAGTQSEREKLSKRLWKLRNVEKHRAQSRRAERTWRVKHPDDARESSRQYAEQHPEAMAAKYKRDHEHRMTDGREQWLSYQRNWRAKNRKRIRKRDRDYYHRVRKQQRKENTNGDA